MDKMFVYGLAAVGLIVSDLLLMALGAYCYRLLLPRHDERRGEIEQDMLQDLKALTLSVSVIGERLLRLETQIGRLQQDSQEIQTLPVAKEVGRQAIRVATKLALQGADVEEIVNLCGLTRGEAELIRMLHPRGDQTSKASTS